MIIGIAYVFIKYNDDLPVGQEGEAADQLARSMEVALNKEAFDNTSYFEWQYRNSNKYKWDRRQGRCQVTWKDFKVDLDIKNPPNSKAYVHNFQVHNEQAKTLIKKAISFFNNDSFWLVAPYKTFDEGAKRAIVDLESGEKGLLVTYTSGGSTPGDSYLWLLDEDGKPKAFKIWASALPLKGLYASWDDWIQVESGALLPQSHDILFITADLGDVKGR